MPPAPSARAAPLARTPVSTRGHGRDGMRAVAPRSRVRLPAWRRTARASGSREPPAPARRPAPSTGPRCLRIRPGTRRTRRRAAPVPARRSRRANAPGTPRTVASLLHSAWCILESEKDGAQLLHRAVDPDLDGTDLDAKRLGNPLVRESVEAGQDQQVARPVVQLLHRAAELLDINLALEPTVGTRVRSGHLQCSV